MASRILVAAFLALWLPVASHAIGLGEISLDSALNQPFDATIPITGAAAGEAESLTVRLASRETFERYGLDRPAFLAEFDFSVRTDGPPRVLVTSRLPVVEPFVTFLVEVDWAQGRLLREFTVLLDPPVFQERAEPAAIEPPLSQAGTSPRSGTIDRPVASAPDPVAAPRRDQSLVGDSSGGEYGPVSRNETLWSIARRTRPSSSVDINQMMVAIFEANPDAFNGNINSLRAGAILRLPDSDQLGSVSRRSANAEVRRQHDAWASRGGGAGRLRLVPPEDAPGDSTRSGTVGADLAGDAAETVRPDGVGDGRIEALEAELQESRQLLQVRDEELRALQERLAALETAADDAAAVDDAAVADDPATGAVAEPDVADSDEAMADERADDAGATDEVAGDEADATPGDEVAQSDLPPARTDVVVTTPESESWIDGVIGLLTNIWLWVAALVVVLVTLFAARFRRQGVTDETGRWGVLQEAERSDSSEEAREATEQMRAHARQDDDSIVVEEQPAEVAEAFDEIDSDTVTESPLDDLLDEEPETPLETTLSSETALNLDQADPVAEAEFHMAYGLYDQAADLLNNALSADPDQLDLRLKLLEVYFVWENADGFLHQAQELRSQHADLSDAAWGKVVIMGKQLCPDDDLFSDRAESVAGDVDLAFGDESTDDAGAVDVELDADTGDSGIFDAPVDTNSGDEIEADESDGAMDLDFDATGLAYEGNTIDQPGPESPTVESPTIESPAADPTVESPTVETPEPFESDEGTSQLPSLDDGLAEELGQPSPPGDETAEIDLDDLGLDLTGLDAAVEQVTADLGETGEIAAPDLHSIADEEEYVSPEFVGGETTVSGDDEYGLDDDQSGDADDADQVADEEKDAISDEDATLLASADDVVAEFEDDMDGEATEELPDIGALSPDLDFGDEVDEALLASDELLDATEDEEATTELPEVAGSDTIEEMIGDEDATLLASAADYIAEAADGDDEADSAEDESGSPIEGEQTDDAEGGANDPTAELDFALDQAADEAAEDDDLLIVDSASVDEDEDEGDDQDEVEDGDVASTAELPVFDGSADADILGDADATAELASIPDSDEFDVELDDMIDDTVEQPALEDTAEQPASEDVFDVLDSEDADQPEETESDEADAGAPAQEHYNPVQAEQTMTEVGTKLDLARAYVDMGDPDGARSILNEVLEEGDEEQQQAARDLLDGLPD